jgi:hypothetical protein
MENQTRVHQQDLIKEIKAIPSEHFPDLLKIIRMFRQTALFTSRSRNRKRKPHAQYPLRGIPFTYIDPTDPVGVDDWEVLQ